MKNLLMRTGLMMTIFFALATLSSGQNSEPGPVVQYPVYFDVSPPLRDMAKKFPGKADNTWKDGVVKNKFNIRKKPAVSTPGGLLDPYLQLVNGMMTTDTTIQNFDGNTNTEGVVPPDTHGDVGPNHYFQVVNCHYSIYSKTGTLLLGPLSNSSVFSGLPNNSNDGDAVVIYDEQADRWLFSQFSLPNYPDGPYYQMIAVSATGDPTGSWYRYQYTFTNMPDYPKFGVWPDGYYMSANQFTASSLAWGGCLAAAFDRSAMLAGSSSSSMITFTKPSTNEAFSWLPSDCDGAFPTGSPPNYFVYMYDGSSTDHLGLYEFHVDWTTPANSTFTNFLSLPVTAFTTNVSGIDQPSTTVNLDPINDRLMYRLQYRKFSGYEAMVCNHTVDISSSVAGIRWYELRKTTGSWSVYQQGTYAPSDGNSRWMASVAMDGNGNIALGYSISGASLYPSIRYAGRKNGDPVNTMTIAEKGIFTGTGAQTTSWQRWGDYSSMSCDPSVNGLFWYTNEYLATTSSSAWKTRIASFRFSNPPVTVTSAATAVTPTSATLNGTVNPNGLATTWYFEWGTTTAYGNTTAVTSAGTGTSTVNVNAGITGLTGGVTYHYRLVATNTDGTSYGADMTFTYGAAMVTTTAALSITATSAVSGGTVTSDGGYAVTARGVCWGTSANPTISGNHTTDGSGTGTFTSTITGLSANTQYHVRSYATNSVGTFYGDDLTFTTLCGVSSIPLSENFNGATIPSCWTQQVSAGASSSWSVSSTANAGGTTNEMKSSYQNVNPGVTRLVTIPINTVGVGQLNLSFRHMLEAYTTGATLSVQSSTDGTNWTTESWTVATTSSNISATLVNTVINNNLNSATTYVAFTVSGNLFNYDYWYIDNVQITGCASYLPVSVSIAASANPICSGSAVTFTATPFNGGASPAYQWKKNTVNISGATNATYSYTPANGDVITCVLTSNATCISGNPATSNAITMTVNPLLPVSVSIDASATTVCAGTSVTFTTTPNNGGASPAYQWKKNTVNISGATNATYNYTPANGDVINCVLTSNATCISGNPATSNTITMTVNQMLPVSVSIVASATTVCEGSQVEFTATPVNGGSSPSYQWQVNGINAGTNSPVFTYTPSNGDQIMVHCQSSIVNCVSGNPATSNAITMTANPSLPVSVSIGASANPVCYGSLVEFTATPVNGGTSPSYQWQVNGINAGTDSPVFTYTPVNGDQIMVHCQSSIGNCVSGNPATSNTIIMTVDQMLPVSVSIVASANPVCHGSLVDFTATPVNGGPNPVYTWVVNGIPAGANSPQFSYVPENYDVVACYLTSDAACVTGSPAISNMIPMAVHAVPLPVIISSSDPLNIVCPNSGGHQYFTTPDWSDYTWNIQGPGNTTIFSGQHTSAITAFWGGPAGTTGTLQLVVKDQLGCEGTSLATTVSIGPDFTAGSVGNSQTIVAGGTPDPLTATTPTGPGSYTFQWQSSADGTLFIDIAGATGLTYTPGPLFTSTWFRQLQTAVEGCVTKPTNDLKINVLQIQGTVSLQPDLTRCAGDTLHVPVHLTGNDIYSLELFITYDHTLLNLHPIRYTNVYPSFAVTAFNATYDPNTLRIVVEQTGFFGVDFSGQKMLDLVFTMTAPGSTTLHLRTAPDAVPVCSLWDSFGNEIFPVTYLDNQVNVNPQFIAGTIAADQTIEYNTVPDPLTATPPTTGVPPYTYQWQASVDGLTFVNIFGETGLTYAPGALTLTTWYRQIQSSSGNCGSLPTNVVVITVNPQPYITITSPNGGEEWTQGSTQTITWNDNIPEDVKIELYKSGLFLQTITPSAASTGSFIWNIPADQLAGNDYKVKITSTTDPAIFDYSNAEFTIAPTVPPVRIVQNVTVGEGEIFCYDATTTILVAGGGTTFLVQNGGSATFIAGQNIIYLPGTKVKAGGYMLGKITTTNQFCGSVIIPAMVATGTEEPTPVLATTLFRLYPNPTRNAFTVEQSGTGIYDVLKVEIYNMMGEQILTNEIIWQKKHEFLLSSMPVGVYFVRITGGDQTETIKLIKQ